MPTCARVSVLNDAITVLGLNPHAGEQGYLGHEEIDTITPTLDACATRQHLIGVAGRHRVPAAPSCRLRRGARDVPRPRFARAQARRLRGRGQHHPGLPYPRVAVDHGTADLAGSGRGDPSASTPSRSRLQWRDFGSSIRADEYERSQRRTFNADPDIPRSAPAQRRKLQRMIVAHCGAALVWLPGFPHSHATGTRRR